MPYYTQDYDFTITLPNDIRDGSPNPFVEGYIQDSTFVNGVGDDVYEINNRLVPNSKLADGENENYKDQYYKDLYSAPTTAGYTNMEQHVFVSRGNILSGWQNKSTS